MKTAVLGDVGQTQYHVGDEAMAHAAARELEARGIEDLVILTRDPSESEREYGKPARLRPQVPWNAFERHRAFEELLDPSGRSASEGTRALRAAILGALEGCEALLLAGGGNLTSQYGGLLFERMAFMHLAAQQGIRVVVSGQTVGPVLTAPDAAHLGPVLADARLVGARERESKELLDDLGVPSAWVLDDASFLTQRSEDGGYLAVTLAPGSGAMGRSDYIETMARLVTRAARASGLPALFVPHVSTFGQDDGDTEVHRAVAALLDGVEAEVLSQKNALETSQATVDASLVLSTRYHPVVFALGAGVPVMPVAVDLYGEVRIGGALENWGARGLLRSLRQLGGSEEDAWTEAALQTRGRLASHLDGLHPKMAEAHGRWWDAAASALRGQPASPTALPEAPIWQDGSGVLAAGSEGWAGPLNAGNELAIGNLLQHVDWLQGELRAERDNAAGASPSSPDPLRRAARSVVSRFRGARS
ncbi:polysaccharide pyruvyl transferase family protein [Sinomonas susongensis]|uniref:polysaccharide pyruvyl transferase family protein n=1 Tax=Sinomonas susongensis TaxID=1324851 RepID=UPI001109DFF7|nr:polysaccharide pyruvyl transferase family protein [Sinomonas susongensis]